MDKISSNAALLTTVATILALASTGGCQEKAPPASQGGTFSTELSTAAQKTEQYGAAEVTVKGQRGDNDPITSTGTYSWIDDIACDVTVNTAAARAQRLVKSSRMRLIVKDNAYYYQVNPRIKGKRWVRVEGTGVPSEQAAREAMVEADPTAALRAITNSHAVDDLGWETIRGTRAHHYRAKLDASRLGDDVENALGSALGGSSAIVDAWISRKDLPVRTTQTVGTYKVTIDFLKFGATTTITAPATSDTATLADVAESGIRQP
ncbi:hypothetical protein [Streptomyces sp. NPDC127084]|uniref:hypothetical protein n=1 Tax=Streptomyces sp. NPDC127084 TaxID=3347133 RepID=UPI00365B5F0B